MSLLVWEPQNPLGREEESEGASKPLPGWAEGRAQDHFFKEQMASSLTLHSAN